MLRSHREKSTPTTAPAPHPGPAFGPQRAAPPSPEKAVTAAPPPSAAKALSPVKTIAAVPRSRGDSSLSSEKAATTLSHPTTTASSPPPATTSAVRRADSAENAAFSAHGKKTMRVFGQGGIAMVRFVCRLPDERPPDGFPEARETLWTAFLTRAQALAKETEELCRTQLLQRMKEIYDADPDPRKRFRFKGATVTLTCDIGNEKEGVYEVLWHFAVVEAGKNTAEKSFCEHLFTTLPPVPEKARRGKHKPGRKKSGSEKPSPPLPPSSR